MTSFIYDIWDYKNGKVAVVVNTEHAESLYNFLKDNGIKCDTLSEGVYSGTKLYRDKNGNFQCEQQCVSHVIEVYSTFNETKNIAYEWCQKTFYRKPTSK